VHRRGLSQAVSGRAAQTFEVAPEPLISLALLLHWPDSLDDTMPPFQNNHNSARRPGAFASRALSNMLIKKEGRQERQLAPVTEATARLAGLASSSRCFSELPLGAVLDAGQQVSRPQAPVVRSINS
jgi:hypothetical protein